MYTFACVCVCARLCALQTNNCNTQTCKHTTGSTNFIPVMPRTCPRPLPLCWTWDLPEKELYSIETFLPGCVACVRACVCISAGRTEDVRSIDIVHMHALNRYRQTRKQKQTQAHLQCHTHHRHTLSRAHEVSLPLSLICSEFHR